MARNPIDWSPKNWLRLLYDFFSSFKLATAILIFITLVTLLGTLGQVDHGLHAAKEKYFHSFYFVERFGPVPVVLPGGLLLMILLFVNMVVGAIIRVKKRWKGVGLLISHLGILMLLVGGFVTWAFSTDGFMALYPGMSSDRVESYRDWQLEIVPLTAEGKGEKAWIYPSRQFESLRPGEERTLDASELPFTVVVSDYSKNTHPIPISAPMASQVQAPEVNGYKLAVNTPSKEAEQNLPGCYLTIQPRKGGDSIRAILWAASYRFDPKEKSMPFTFTVDGQLYAALLCKKSWTVPFTVKLDRFDFSRHPGVMMARSYESLITRSQGDHTDKQVEIKMNEPMRYAGFTFFQESFGPAGAQPGDDMFSQFAVANNPADQWPLYALIVVAFGLSLHFLLMLFQFIVRSRHKTPPTPFTS